MEIRTFHIVGEERNLGDVVVELTTDLLIGRFLKLRTCIDSVVVCREEMLDVLRGLAVLHV
jgi:hypothetical protein